MIRKAFAASAAFIVLVSFLMPGCSNPPYYEKLKKVFPAVVRVVAGDQMGSGVIISGKSYVLTSQHVVKGNKTAYVLLNSGAQYQGSVEVSDPQRDLAIIKLPEDAANLPAANLGRSEESDELQTSSPVLVLGYPAGNEINNIKLTTGILCAFRTIENVAYLQSDAAVEAGMSGGPMLNTNGEVIGVINSKYAGLKRSCATFATASSEATATIDELTRPSKPQPVVTNTELIISKIRTENITTSGALILWETSIPAISGVEFGITPSSKYYPSNEGKPAAIHRIQISDLEPKESYRFRITATGQQGQQSSTEEMMLTTQRTACANVGCRAPDFNLARVGGGSLSLDSLKGKKAILVFITTGCSSCAEVMRCIHKIYDNWPREQMEVVGIVSDEKEEDVQRWIKMYAIECPVVLDPGRVIINEYKPMKMPALYFLSVDGDIKAKKYYPISGCGNEIDSVLRLY
jgi:peroxiredoxin/V8-like Glu-specific endopeptidase